MHKLNFLGVFLILWCLGTLAAMYTILRRLEIDGNVEVKETVRLIRYQRASMVQVVKQYVFLYTVSKMNDFITMKWSN